MTASHAQPSWRKTKLGDYFRIKHGYAFKGEFFSDEGPYVLLTPGNFQVDGGIKLKGEREKYYTGDFPEEFLLKRGDFLIVMTDLTQNAPILGSPALIKEDDKFLHNQRLGKIVELNESEMDRMFLYYLFNTTSVRAQIKASATGATVRHTAPDRIYAVKVEVPSLPIQHRIASILSAYDDLIENNTRRIKILEEMARLIYREWFVEFRAPGVKLRQATPEGQKVTGREVFPVGWKIAMMREVAEVIDCLHSKKPQAVDDGKGILLQLSNIADGGKLDLSKQYRINQLDYELWTSRIEASPGDCIVTNVGRIAAVAQIPEGVRAALGRNMTAIRPKVGLMTSTFLIEYLLSPLMESEVRKKKDTGTIMDSLNVKGIVRLEVPLPSYDLMARFEEIARPLRRRIELLVAQNKNLRQTRDLLLPKLVSGEVEVGVNE